MKKTLLTLVTLSLFTLNFFTSNAQTWQQLGIDMDGEATDDQSGYSVSLSADGSTVAIGAPFNGGNAGHVRIYQWDVISSAWIQQGLDIDGEVAGDQSGWSVSLSADGSTVAIGAPYNNGNGGNAGHVRIYQWDGSLLAWIQQGADIDGEVAGDQSGNSVSLSADGSTVAIGAQGNDETGSFAGHVRIYQWDGSLVTPAWIQQGLDIDGEAAEDFSGWSVSLSADGSTVAIGAGGNDETGSFAGHVRIYQWDGSLVTPAWIQQGLDIDGEAAGDYSGNSVSLSADGSTVAIGAPFNGGNAGHVRIYQWDVISSAWIQQGLDIDGEVAGDQSGWSVSLSADGSTVAIGAPYNNGNGGNAGHVRIYQWDGSLLAWIQQGADIDGEVAGDQSGYSVSLSADGSTMAIGARYNDGNGSNAGHVRVYEFITPQLSVSVSGNSQDIPNNGTPMLSNHTHFGSLASGGNLTKTYTLKNTGTVDLVLDATAVTLTGSADFTLVAQPTPLTLAPAASTTFQITFTPSSPGVKTATVSIASNDPNSPFTFEVQGAANTALNFDGTDYVEIGNVTDLSFERTDAFTIEAWVKKDPSVNGYQVICSNIDYNDPNYTGYELAINNDGKIYCYIGGTTSKVLVKIGDNSLDPSNTGVWRHVAVTYSGNSDVSGIILYLDGVVEPISSSENTLGATSIQNTNPISLGFANPYTASDFPFTGSLDEVRIWNRALCQSEIQGRMNASLEGNENGLVAYYDFEEGTPSGTNTALTEVKDKAGTNHGTMNGFAKTGSTSNWVDGQRLVSENTALNFDGLNDVVFLSNPSTTVSAASLGLPTTQITLEAWIRVETLTSTWGCAVGFTQDNGSFEHGWTLGVRQDGKIFFGLSTGGGLTYLESSTSNLLNTWYHLVATYDGSAMRLYIDGIENINVSKTGSISYADSWLTIGQFKDDNENYFLDCDLDELSIWDKALTQAEIKANMNAKLRGDESGLVAYYDFQEGAPNGTNTALTTVTDKAGNNTGTLSGFAKTGATSNWVSGNSAVETSTIVGTRMTWLGTTADWNTTTNWTPNGIPDQCTDVLIPMTANDPTFADNQAVNSITIDATATLTVGAGGCLWVGSDFTNDGDFILEATATNYAQYQGPQVKGTLSQVIGEAGWHSIASPFIDTKLEDIIFDQGAFLQIDVASKTNIQTYNSSNYQATPPGTWANAWGSWEIPADLTAPFDGSVGYNLYLDSYFMSGTFPVTMSITGTLRNMPLRQELKKSNGGWNQLSNPFPSVVDFDKLYDNSAIGSSYRLWDPVSQVYATLLYDPNTGTNISSPVGLTRYIAPYQSVWVKTHGSATADPGAQALGTQDHSISNADRPSECLSATNTFYKTEALTGVLRLQTSLKGLTDEVLIRFGEDYQEGYTNMEDASKFFSANTDIPTVFTLVEEQACVIASYPYPDLRAQSIPLGYTSTRKGEVKIELTETKEGLIVILEDSELGVFHNLKTPYTFTTEEETEDSRFKLHTGGTNSNIYSYVGGDQLVYTKYDNIVFYDSKSLAGAKFSLLNVAGQELLNGTVTEGLEINTSIYPSGVYLLKVNSRGDVKTQRVMVQ